MSETGCSSYLDLSSCHLSLCTGSEGLPKNLHYFNHRKLSMIRFTSDASMPSDMTIA